MTNMDVVVFGSGSVLLDPLSLDPLSWALLLFVFCCCFFSRPIVVGSVVFPALCTCICVLVLCIFVLTHRDVIFDVLELPAFKNMAHVGSFKHFGIVYFCMSRSICYCLCRLRACVDIRDHKLSENIWFDGSLKLGN